MSAPARLNAEIVRGVEEYLAAVRETDVPEPTAVLLATADRQGRPSSRTVLLKGFDERGFVIYTNFRSRKGQELQANPWASLTFHSQALGKQLHAQGPVEVVTEAEADAYFASRARGSQIGAWASEQSEGMPAEGRAALQRRIAEYEEKFTGGEVPRPAHWSGFRILPERVEFWTNGEFRLHDRQVWERDASGAWTVRTLYP